MELIYVKEVDKSLLYQGFTVKAALLDSFLGSAYVFAVIQ